MLSVREATTLRPLLERQLQVGFPWLRFEPTLERSYTVHFSANRLPLAIFWCAVGIVVFDLMSLSGHKIYGPNGIGACYVRRRPRVRIDPIISGGGQERGLRSGTLAPALIIGMGEAARICNEEMQVSCFSLP